MIQRPLCSAMIALSALCSLGCGHRPPSPPECRARYKEQRDQPTQYGACLFRWDDYVERQAARERKLRGQGAACAPPQGQVSVQVGGLVTRYAGPLSCSPVDGGLFCTPPHGDSTGTLDAGTP